MRIDRASSGGLSGRGYIVVEISFSNSTICAASVRTMHDPRIDQLADLLLDHSCPIEKGEKVLIEAFDLPEPTLVCRLVEGAAKRGAVPLVSWKSNAVLRSLYHTATDESMKLAGQIESSADGADARLHRHSRRSQQQSVRRRAARRRWISTRSIGGKRCTPTIRVPKTKWVVLRYPTDSFAQAANMSTSAFEDFYFDVCTADYAAMARSPKAARRANAASRSRPHRRPRHGIGILDQGDSGHRLLGRAEHSGRRSVHRAGAREHQRQDSLQHAVALSGHGVRQYRV